MVIANFSHLLCLVHAMRMCQTRVNNAGMQEGCACELTLLTKWWWQYKTQQHRLGEHTRVSGVWYVGLDTVVSVLAGINDVGNSGSVLKSASRASVALYKCHCRRKQYVGSLNL